MNRTSPPSGAAALVIGLVGLALLPLILTLDSTVAMARGWQPRTAGTFGLLAYAFAGLVFLLLAALVLPPVRRLLRGRARQLWIFSVGLLVGWAVAEVLVMALFAGPGFHLRAGATEHTFTPDPFQMPGVSSEARSSYNSLGIRGAELPPRDEAYRILCVGGSTTECYYLDDSQAWPLVLAERLNAADGRRYWVGAAAVSEAGTAQHLEFIRTSPLVGEMDALVLLVGGNDLVRSVLGLPVEASGDAPLWLRSKLLSLARYVWNVPLGKSLRIDATGERLHEARMGRPIPPREIDIEGQLAGFEARLRAIVEAADERGVRLVLVTQPVLWDDFLTMLSAKKFWLTRVIPIPRDWDYLTASNLRDASDLYSQTVVTVGRETGTEVIDAALDLSGKERVFYDDYHLNVEGNAELAAIVAEYFRTHPDGP